MGGRLVSGFVGGGGLEGGRSKERRGRVGGGWVRRGEGGAVVEESRCNIPMPVAPVAYHRLSSSLV